MVRRRRRIRIKAVFSAFIWGVLISIGLQPGQVLFETALDRFGIYLQALSLIILVVTIYFSHDSIVEAFFRLRSAYRVVGAIGVMAIALAMASGYVFVELELSVLTLLLALLMWIYAQIA